MRVLALNCGSSSVKSAIIDVPTGKRLLDVRIEDVRAEDGGKAGVTLEVAVHRVIQESRVCAQATGAVQAVAHRVVHGGPDLVQPTFIDDESLRAIDALSELAPLHNPPAVAAIRIVREAFPDLPQIAVFDTAFHATLPPHAREYALPADLTKRLGIRRFGFHGISHAYVMASVAEHLKLNPQSLRIISCHLGNGASVAAIERGFSVDTSMGMTPMEGLVMGTRAGDLDPGVILYLLQSGQSDVGALDKMLNTRSGLTGLAGTNDMREIARGAASGDESCRLAFAVYGYRVRKYIGAYAAAMGGVDVIAFTGGIGENSAVVRQQCLQRLEFLGVALDEKANRNVTLAPDVTVARISAERSRISLLVVRADEELAIAREASAAISG